MAISTVSSPLATSSMERKAESEHDVAVVGHVGVGGLAVALQRGVVERDAEGGPLDDALHHLVADARLYLGLRAAGTHHPGQLLKGDIGHGTRSHVAEVGVGNQFLHGGRQLGVVVGAYLVKFGIHSFSM